MNTNPDAVPEREKPEEMYDSLYTKNKNKPKQTSYDSRYTEKQ